MKKAIYLMALLTLTFGTVKAVDGLKDKELKSLLVCSGNDELGNYSTIWSNPDGSYTRVYGGIVTHTEEMSHVEVQAWCREYAEED